jgi:hypothetical protein
MAAHAKVFVQVIFARTQGSEGKQEILLKVRLVFAPVSPCHRQRRA